MEQSRKDSLRESRYMGSTGDQNKIIRILLQSMTLRTNRWGRAEAFTSV